MCPNVYLRLILIYKTWNPVYYVNTPTVNRIL